jgi:hypothetical protein
MVCLESNQPGQGTSSQYLAKIARGGSCYSDLDFSESCKVTKSGGNCKLNLPYLAEMGGFINKYFTGGKGIMRQDKNLIICQGRPQMGDRRGHPAMIQPGRDRNNT